MWKCKFGEKYISVQKRLYGEEFKNCLFIENDSLVLNLMNIKFGQEIELIWWDIGCQWENL